jgi:microcystin-dependent protein
MSAQVSITGSVPIGSVTAYVGTELSLNGLINQGWLLCDGSLQLTANFPDLFAAIGVTFGGDGNDNFNLPDLRGVFLRGVDGGAGIDPDSASRTAPQPGGNTSGDSIGTFQADALKMHSHTWSKNFENIGDDGSDIAVQLAENSPKGPTNLPPETTTDVNGESAESRPVNVYVYYLIYAGATQ